MSVLHKKQRFHLPQADAEVDLVPLIDCVFLLLLFFMLCGRIAMDQRAEQITVPPTKTSAPPPKLPSVQWSHFIINVFGSTKEGKPPRNTIEVSGHKFETSGYEKLGGYQQLRTVLNNIYDKAEKYSDPNPENAKAGLKLPQVVLEIRADADTEYRVVQEIQQVASDTINPFDSMKPHNVPLSQLRPFVLCNFTTRRPEDKN